MKRLMCMLLVIALLAVGAAWAEEELHLLWGIEFGQDIETVQQILKYEHGLDMKYSQTEDSNALYTWLRCENTDEMTVLGYPVYSFEWDVKTNGDYREEKVTIFFFRDLSELYDESAAEMQPLAHILSTLVEQFGPIDFATYTIYRAGGIAWRLKDRDNTYEFGHFEDLDINSLNLRAVLEMRDYITNESSVWFDVYIDNIKINCYKASPNSYSIEITFSDSVYEDTQEDTYEEFKLAQPAQYEDKGF